MFTIFRYAAGVALFFAVLSAVLYRAPVIWPAYLGGLAAAAATGFGALAVFFTRRPFSEKIMDALSGFGAGVMLAAVSFSLVLPAMDFAEKLHGKTQAGLIVASAVLAGSLLLMLMEKFLPHEHFIKGTEGSPELAQHLQRSWLFVFAITLHNLPEGVAIGVGFAGSPAAEAAALATGISIQDIPEGLVVALALMKAGYGRAHAAAVGVFSGLIEPLGAIAGAAAVSQSTALLPWGLGGAAGAMLFVISHEIIPESHRKGHEFYATGGLMLGFVLMMFLDTVLG